MPTPLDRDWDLLAVLREREPTAAETLINAYGDRAYRLASGITGNGPDAEEVVQDAFWSVVRKIDTFRGDSSLGSWIYRIVANAAYGKLRDRAHRRDVISLDEILALFQEDRRHTGPISDWSANIHDPALQTELRATLRSAIGDLPAHYRAVIVLHDVEGMSLAEVASSVGITVAAAKACAHRARLFLRKRLSTFMAGVRAPGDSRGRASAAGAPSYRAGDRANAVGAPARGQRPDLAHEVGHHVVAASSPNDSTQRGTIDESARHGTSAMPLPAETKVQGRRAAASCGCSHDGKLDRELAPRRLENDRRLVEALRLAEPTAAEDLVASYGGQAHRLAFGITGNQSDAEEVVQDALWKVVRKIDAFRGNSAFGSWLYRIVANVAYDKLRHRRGRFGDCSLDEVSATVDERGESFVDWSSRTRDPSLETELRIVLTTAIEALPENYRTVAVLRDVQGLSTHEIAQITRLSVASVKVRTHRARLVLRKWLETYFESRDRRSRTARPLTAAFPGRCAAGVVTGGRGATS
jgi:RNA polymerase sigma-70 factor, ECF subfamily